MYPKATFLNRRSLRIQTHDEKRSERWRLRYGPRGIQYINWFDTNYADASTLGFLSGNRFVGDYRTWVVPISRNKADGDFHVHLNSWALEFCGPTAIIETSLVTSPLLLRKYMCAPSFGHLIQCSAGHWLEDLIQSSEGE